MTSRCRRACRGGVNADLAGTETGGDHDAIASPLKPRGVSSASPLLSILFTALPAMLNFSRLLSSFGNAAPSGPVFVSHSSRNLKLAWAATAELEAGGVRCWFAPRDIRPGEPNYGRAIIEGLSGCRAMVLLLTESSNVSQHVMKEAERAVNKKTPILVVRFDSVPLSRDLEYYVSSAQFLDAMEAPPQRHFPAITDRLREILREAPQDSPAKPTGDAATTPATISTAARPREQVVTTAKEVPTANVVTTAFDGCASSALHVAPNIPTDKAQSAIGRYAPQVKEAEILLLFDATVFATATDGFLLTAGGVHWHNAMSPARYLRFTEIFTVDSTAATFFTTPKLRLNGEEIDVTGGDSSQNEEISRRAASLLKQFAPNAI
jgi:hypothetical protein